ncbi:MAG: hypothetical protein QJR03_08685 [Sphaerobacter sp.]|nr:hypothetical protein [Sphaerobacter sp.]
MMSLSRRAPILWLTLRQFRAGRATWLAALFAATPILLAVIHRLGSRSVSDAEFLANLFLEVLAPTVVPLATLMLATNALGNELADRTVPYLLLKPIARARIVVEKFLASALVTSLTLAVGLLVTWAVASSGAERSSRMLAALLGGTLAGMLAYGALFMLISLLIQRALLVGIIYALIWESALARFIPGVKLLSIRHFSQSVFVRLLDDPTVTLDRALQLPSALAVLVVVTVAALTVASLLLRRINAA